MKTTLLRLTAVLPACVTLNLLATIHYVSVNNTIPVSPYTNWATAATNIEDALSVASSGDTVLVTNGVYQYGGFGTGWVRAYVPAKVILQSVNGPTMTAISGAGSAQCAYLQTGAILSGFTLVKGVSDTGGAGVSGVPTNCVVTNCIITGNYAVGLSVEGGGALGVTLWNCVLTGNSASQGSALFDCTGNNCLIVGNTNGPALYDSTLNNCTVAGNFSQSGGSAENCTMNNTIDYGNHNNNQPDCAGCTLVNCCTTLGSGNTTVNCLTAYPAYVNTNRGDYHLQVGSPCIDAGTNVLAVGTVDLDGNPRIVGAWVDMGCYESAYTNVVHYVSQATTNALAPYTNWSTAAAHIQDAVAVSLAGQVVLVSNGVYGGSSGITVNGLGPSLVALTNPITVVSLDGAASTIITGGKSMRCVYVGTNAVLNGFGLLNGSATAGAGLWSESRGTVSNCIIGGVSTTSPPFTNSFNQSSGQGGGVYGGKIVNTIIAGNSASYGGGAATATLYDCILTTNAATSNGGAVYDCTLYNCIVMSNQALNIAGGCVGSTLYNCTIAGNLAALSVNIIGGVSACALYNCIVLSNDVQGEANYDAASTLAYCDATPLAPGPGNITNAPSFVNLAAYNVHLQSNSPCINAGNNACVTTSIDYDGNPRIGGGTVDLGAYEYQTPTSVISYAWLDQYGLPTDGSADFIDSDGDGMNNWEEWIAGTNPRDPNSALRVLSASSTNNPPGVAVQWQSVNGINYFLQRAGALSAPAAFSIVQTNITGQSNTTSYVDPTATNGGPYFYRVGVP